MPPPVDSRQGTWASKFGCAARGIRRGIRSQRSFAVHVAMAAAVVAAGVVLSVSLLEWCVLALCIVAVLAAELFNTAIEYLARAITHQSDPHIRDALDTSSGAVLLAAIGAAIVGSIVFFHRLGCLLNWWDS